MTTLQEAARDALEALEHIQRCIGFGTATIHQGSATWCQSDDAIKSLKAALAQQGEQRCAYCDGTGDVHGIDGEWRGSCPCAAAPAPQAQHSQCFMCHGKGEHPMATAHLPGQPEPKPMMVKCRQCQAPQPAQDKSDNYLSGYCTGRTDLLKEQSAQPVTQPLTPEQILDIVKKLDETPDMSHVDVLKTFARAIESAHGIREVK